VNSLDNDFKCMYSIDTSNTNHIWMLLRTTALKAW
jgi:hypothetical protein